MSAVQRATYPRCPECGSTAKQCRRPSGHGCAWHVAREDVAARECLEATVGECEVCRAWLDRAPEPVAEPTPAIVQLALL